MIKKTFYKILKSQSPNYLHQIILETIESYRIKQNNKLPVFSTFNIAIYVKSTFFFSTVNNLNDLCPEIQISENIVIFKKSIITFIWPVASNTFNFHNPRGPKFLLQLLLTKIISKKIIENICICGVGAIETCCNYSTERLALLNSIRNIDSSILQKMTWIYNPNFIFLAIIHL